MTYPSIVLCEPLEDTLLNGHPWVYEGSFHPHDPFESGNVVDILGQQGEWIARGVYDADSPIRVRVWTTRERTRVNNQLLEERIRDALKRRPFPSSATTGFRLLNGEGDRVPGLVCDIYANVAVFRVDGIGAERWLEPAERIVSNLLDIEHVAVRRSEIYRRGRPAAQWVTGGVDEVAFKENDITFVCDPIQGQKTGFFLDQRANRARVAQSCVGRRLLNLFGYTGGFSIAAACAGAARTTTVDLSKPALSDARRIFEMNGVPSPAHAFEASDVFEYLKQFDEGSAPFDVVVCDPPSFIHKRENMHKGIEAYVDLFSQTLRIMPSRSRVALASCSSHIDREKFMDIVSQAARKAGVAYVVQGLWGADVDHCFLPNFTEADYLQFAIGTLHRD